MATSGMAPLGFPGRGHPIKVTAPTPAAGADWALTPPPGSVWRIIGGSAQLQSSNQAATRQVLIQVLFGPDVLFVCPSPNTQSVSLTYTYQILPSITQATLVSTYPVVGIPPLTYLDNRFRIQSSTVAIQTNDQWSAIVLLVEELVQAPPM